MSVNVIIDISEAESFVQTFIPGFGMSVQVKYNSPENSPLDFVVCYRKSRHYWYL